MHNAGYPASRIMRAKEDPMLENFNFEWLSEPSGWIALLTLTVLELVLGIDNIVFIAVIADKLPEEHRERTRRIGLILAMGLRILLLLCISMVLRLEKELFAVLGHGFTGKDLVLIVGGLFLLGKATHEIHSKLEGGESENASRAGAPSVTSVIIQILLLDLVFSIDSVVTAVGMVEPDKVSIMITAVVISVLMMLLLATPISKFVNQHPTVKMLALSFLLLIGMSLIADGSGHHVPKGYIYFAMGFSVFVEMLNMRLRHVSIAPLRLRSRFRRRSKSEKS